jgi:hypothetical protein
MKGDVVGRHDRVKFAGKLDTAHCLNEERYRWASRSGLDDARLLGRDTASMKSYTVGRRVSAISLIRNSWQSASLR